jgi:hypothetical protein
MREQILTRADGKNYLIITELYFTAFKSKSLDILGNLYSDNVELTDWVGAWYGKDSVLEANKDLFKTDFELDVNSSFQLNNITYNEITIRFENEVIKVMDVIKFNSEFEIESIRAYKG